MVPATKREATLELAKKQGLLRARDLTASGIPRAYLRHLKNEGALENVGPGLYAASDLQFTQYHSLAAAAKRVPRARVCLLSALRFHGLTTQAPFEVWLAIDVHAWRPKASTAPLRIVHMSGQALHVGLDIHHIEGVDVPIFSASKTIVDCFKFRNKIGLDVALEALKDLKRTKKFDADELWRLSKICRVANVMRPYLEALA
jgi:predicted transcriptional regulator of viral defense system